MGSNGLTCNCCRMQKGMIDQSVSFQKSQQNLKDSSILSKKASNILKEKPFDQPNFLDYDGLSEEIMTDSPQFNIDSFSLLDEKDKCASLEINPKTLSVSNKFGSNLSGIESCKDQINQETEKQPAGQMESSYMCDKENIKLEDGTTYTGKVKVCTFKDKETGLENTMLIEHGLGKKYWPNGAHFYGNFINGRIHGKGTYQFANGDLYEGNFHFEMAEGYGEYRHTNGRMYKGTWKNDLQSGQGSESLPDGQTYEGEYYKGRRHGEGTCKFADDSEYKGQWCNGMIDGDGQMTWSDGRVYNGQWKENRLHGQGCYIYNNGQSYQGNFYNDSKHGYGVYRWIDGRKYDGQWFNGKQHGRAFYTNSKGVMREGIWKDGKRLKWINEEESKQSQTQKKAKSSRTKPK